MSIGAGMNSPLSLFVVAVEDISLQGDLLEYDANLACDVKGRPS